MFQLTSKNVEDLKQSIPVGELSKTFQDAFLVCKWLEMRYIWIDSLCIMQDSAEDWQKEAALMQEVYSQARFNVSATGAVTSDEGLFFDRASLAVVPYVVNIDTSETQTRGRKEHTTCSILPSGLQRLRKSHSTNGGGSCKKECLPAESSISDATRSFSSAVSLMHANPSPQASQTLRYFNNGRSGLLRTAILNDWTAILMVAIYESPSPCRG